MPDIASCIPPGPAIRTAMLTTAMSGLPDACDTIRWKRCGLTTCPIDTLIPNGARFHGPSISLRGPVVHGICRASWRSSASAAATFAAIELLDQSVAVQALYGLDRRDMAALIDHDFAFSSSRSIVPRRTLAPCSASKAP